METHVMVRGFIILILVLGSAIALEEGYTGNARCYQLLFFTLPLLLLIIGIRHKKNSSQ